MRVLKRIFGDKFYKVFHENTKNHVLDNNYYNFENNSVNSDKNKHKKYENAESIELKSAEKSPEENLDSIIQRRRSKREFKRHEILLEELAYILENSAGISENNPPFRRTYPSGGANYPLEMYLFIMNSEDRIKEGLYHYDVLDNKLELIRGTKNIEELRNSVGTAQIEKSSVFVVLTANMERTTDEYGDRGYRYIHIEAGHLMQNICLTSEAIGLSALPYGGINEDKLNHMLDIRNEETIYTALIGKGGEEFREKQH